MTQTEMWWCRYCDWVYASPVALTGLRCRKGHLMKRVTEKELTVLRKAESEVSDGTATAI